jgi:hypothetical protein
VINETPESRYNNIIDGTPFGGINGVSFLAFNAMDQPGLLGLLGQSDMTFGKKGDLLALKAQQGKTKT